MPVGVQKEWFGTLSSDFSGMISQTTADSNRWRPFEKILADKAVSSLSIVSDQLADNPSCETRLFILPTSLSVIDRILATRAKDLQGRVVAGVPTSGIRLDNCRVC